MVFIFFSIVLRDFLYILLFLWAVMREMSKLMDKKTKPSTASDTTDH